MNYSCEELYSEYGQFNSLVTISFHNDSEAYSKFGSSLMGTFLYSYEERQELERRLLDDDVERSITYIKFKSIDEGLDNELAIDLDKKGIRSEDIRVVSSYKFQRHNRFRVSGKKEIQNEIIVEFDSSNMNVQRLELYNMQTRINSGYKLIKEERFKYYGYLSYFDPIQIGKDKYKLIHDSVTGELIDEVKFYFLEAEYFNKSEDYSLSDELARLLDEKSKERGRLIHDELKKSDENIKKLDGKYNENLRSLIIVCSDFEEKVILPYKIPIWWDLERFIHIYVRHVEETKVGDRNETKTDFQYKLTDVRKIIRAVLEKIYPEFEQEIKQFPDKIFKRLGKRSVEYDGNYYRVEIEPNGRLLTFHPYNG